MENLLLLISAPWLLLQALLNGILIGALFSLAAYGMALVWGVMKIINIAQGEFVILGGYVAYFLFTLGIHPLFGVLLAPVVLFMLGWCLHISIVHRIVEKDMFISILATFGISIVIQQLMNSVFGPDVRVADSGLKTFFLLNDSIVIPQIRIVALLVCILIAVLVVLFMKYSNMGKAIRATAQNSRAAKILGIDTKKVYAFTFALNAAICGACGALVAMTFTLHPYIGLPYTVRSFMIVIIAGLGNLPGVILSGAMIGFLEEFSDYLLGAEWRLAVIFSLLVVILVWRQRKLAKKRLYLK
jgi:branched-chain amino acid transport system permease protein